MTNNGQERKPIYNGLISDGEYEAVVVKVTEMPPTEYGTSVRVMFLIDNIQVAGVSYVYFVSSFYDKSYSSNSKTAKFMAAIGQDISGVFPVQGNLVGKKCKIYIEAGPAKYSNKLGREVQYMKVKAVNPINRVIPNPVAHMAQQVPVQQPSFAQPVSTVGQPAYTAAQQTVTQYVPPTPVQAPIQKPAPVAQPVIPTQPAQVQQAIPTVPPANNYQSIPSVAPSFAQPAKAPVAAPVPAPSPTPAQTPVAPAQVQQAEQPLPHAEFTSDDLDF